MCLIIVQPMESPQIPNYILRNAWAENDDGAGYMFAVDGQLIIRKPFHSFRAFRRAYRADYAAHGNVAPFILHFRIATHGKLDKAGTHPHRVNGDLGLAHNGILSFLHPAKHESDTALFVRAVLAHRSTADILSADYLASLEMLIGAGNKLAFLSATGEIAIVNEEAGFWDNGLWYSNSSAWYRSVAYGQMPYESSADDSFYAYLNRH